MSSASSSAASRRVIAPALGIAAVVLLCLTGCGDDTRERALSEQVNKLSEQLQATQARLTQLEDIKSIEKLTRAYGYYIDKGMWSQVAELFAEDSSAQLGGEGIYKGRQGAARLFSMSFGKGIGRGAGVDGLPKGVLFNHPQFQGIVDVDADGKTAHGRWRTLAQVAWHGKIAFWNEGVYENEYVKENGVWKFRKLKFWPTYFTEFDQGWAKQGIAEIGKRANTPSKDYPPDEPAPPEDTRSMYPDYSYVPPYHYPNPVSGQPTPAPAQQ